MTENTYYIEKLKQLIEEKSIEAGRRLTACTVTFGCQMNARDSEKLTGILRECGFELTESENADFVIFNTCTVRDNADQRTFGHLGRISHLKKKNPLMKVAVCGCMMQEKGNVDKIKKSYPFVDLVFGTHNLYRFAEYLWEVYSTDQKVRVMLLGQNVNSYGKGLEDPISFAELLGEVCKVDGIRRVRFMTPHPKDLSYDLIRAVRDNPKAARHIHLPLQSGSDRILKRMNRHYTKERFIELAQKIREEISDVSITTDIIVGFPGETPEDVDDTIDVIERVGFDNAYTFIYSKRRGTPAAAMEDQVPEDVVKAGFDRVLAAVQKSARERAQLLEGRVMEALVEEVNAQKEGYVTGRLSTNMVVHVPGDASMIGSYVPVLLEECRGFYYFGKTV